MSLNKPGDLEHRVLDMKNVMTTPLGHRDINIKSKSLSPVDESGLVWVSNYTPEPIYI